MDLLSDATVQMTASSSHVHLLVLKTPRNVLMDPPTYGTVTPAPTTYEETTTGETLQNKAADSGAVQTSLSLLASTVALGFLFFQ